MLGWRRELKSMILSRYPHVRLSFSLYSSPPLPLCSRPSSIVFKKIKICLNRSPRVNGEINYRDAALALYGFLFAAQVCFNFVVFLCCLLFVSLFVIFFLTYLQTNTYGVFAWTLIHLLQNKPL